MTFFFIPLSFIIKIIGKINGKGITKRTINQSTDKDKAIWPNHVCGFLSHQCMYLIL